MHPEKKQEEIPRMTFILLDTLQQQYQLEESETVSLTY